MTTTKNILTAPDSQRDGVGGRKFSKARSVAERLGICSHTIFRWADAGKITRHKINARVVLFDESEVTAFIESARVEVDPVGWTGGTGD
jgi:excisionase family DNA binding protein